MALREGKCFLVRRFADRGINKNIGDSRVCGDQFNRDRRSAGRGNEIGNRDPQDIIKIERLRQRVQDLEEIRRLRQRVRDLELQRERRVKETESGNVVWDVVNEEEEHPSCYFHHRFFEPICENVPCLPDEEPRYDEDGLSPDEDECVFVYKALSGTNVQEVEPIDYKESVSVGQDPLKMMISTTKNIDSFSFWSRQDRCSSDEAMDLNGNSLMKGMSEYAMVLVTNNIDLSNEHLINTTGLVLVHGGQSRTDEQVSLESPKVTPVVAFGLNEETNISGYNMESPIHSQDLVEIKYPPTNNNSAAKNRLGANNMECMSVPRGTLVENNFHPNAPSPNLHMDGPHQSHGSASLQHDPQRKLIKSNWIGYLGFDGLCDGDRVDVPFDPGGFDSKAKLEDEFFRRGGV